MLSGCAADDDCTLTMPKIDRLTAKKTLSIWRSLRRSESLGVFTYNSVRSIIIIKVVWVALLR